MQKFTQLKKWKTEKGSWYALIEKNIPCLSDTWKCTQLCQKYFEHDKQGRVKKENGISSEIPASWLNFAV